MHEVPQGSAVNCTTSYLGTGAVTESVGVMENGITRDCRECDGSGYVVTYRSMHGDWHITERCSCNPGKPSWVGPLLFLLAFSLMVLVLR